MRFSVPNVGLPWKRSGVIVCVCVSSQEENGGAEKGSSSESDEESSSGDESEVISLVVSVFLMLSNI